MKSIEKQSKLIELEVINAQLREDNRLAAINIIKLQNEIEILKEQFRLFQHQRFAKDRAVPASQGDFFFNEAEMAADLDSVDSQTEETATDVAAEPTTPALCVSDSRQFPSS